MTDKTSLQVQDQEIGAMRHNLNLLRAQLQAGRVEGGFLDKQITKLADLLERLEQEHRQLKKQGRLEGLYNVSRLLGSSLDLQIVLNQVMDAIIQLTGAERGFLMLRNDDGQVEVRAARNLDQKTLTSDQFKYSRTVANRVLDKGESVVTTNAAEDPRFSRNDSIVGQGLRSIMATPLRVRGQVIGLIYVDSSANTGLFEDDDLGMMDAFAGQASIAINNAFLFATTDQKLTARVEELSQLRRIDAQLNETLDADKVMNYTLDWAARVAGADVGFLGLVSDSASFPTISSYGVEADDTMPLALEKSYPQVMKVVQGGETAVINEERRGYGVLIVPVKREQKAFAVIVLRRTGMFSDEQKEVVERVVARAAVAIENARLYAAVQSADRAKSEFVGIVAHDLKVPMTSILGYADLTLMDGGLQEQQVNYQNRIRDTVKRMEMLVSDLADISRIESGHFFMNETRVKTESILQGLRDAIMTQLKTRHHNYVEQIEPNLPDMQVDYYRLLQVLTNLASNAYKYTPDGGTITLGARRVPGEAGKADRIEFSVSDTGIGMSRQAIRKLGTKFWRADDEYTRSQPGTGLGYAITSSLVEQMGSKIVVESEVGKGSKFTFTVPTAKD
ncbi:MAG TPA: GAF domain-containing protein [Phototrophicaceae bacterium]|nr:GAF domain-containing protein [Phototrophicaceae bacterium]